MWRVWIEIPFSGGWELIKTGSPSVWRVWIEIRIMPPIIFAAVVTLRVEGVD